MLLYALYKTAHTASDDFSFKRAFNTATKCVQKRVLQDKIFQLKVKIYHNVKRYIVS